jgi:carboxymethylenebutenolidase
MASQWHELTVDGSPMPTWVGVPEGQGPFPAVVVAQHAGGVDSFIRGFVDRLAEQGYVAAAPALFHRDPNSDQAVIDAMPRDEKRREYIFAMLDGTKDAGVLNDVQAVLDNLERLAGVSIGPVGITGFCMGGRVTFLAAGSILQLTAAAPFYPASVFKVTEGSKQSAFDLIPNINGPVGGFFGDDDENPTKEQVAQISAELTKHGKEHEFTSYPGAGHLFMDFQTPPAYREEIAKDAWEKLLVFFGKTLKDKVAAG